LKTNLCSNVQPAFSAYEADEDHCSVAKINSCFTHKLRKSSLPGGDINSIFDFMIFGLTFFDFDLTNQRKYLYMSRVILKGCKFWLNTSPTAEAL
jgi:hypothetical protein